MILIKRSKDEGKPSAKFLRFWKEVYDSGKRKVPNPNQATKKTHPKVSASTAMKTPAFQAKVEKEFQNWLEDEYDGEEDEYEEKEEEEEEEGDDENGKSSLSSKSLSNPKRVAEFKKLVSKTCSDIKKEIDSLSDAELDKEFESSGLVTSDSSRLLKNMSSVDKKSTLMLVKGSDKLRSLWEEHRSNPKIDTSLSKDWISHSESPAGLALSLIIQDDLKYLSVFKNEREWDEALRGHPNISDSELKKWMSDIQSFNQAVFEELDIKQITIFRGCGDQGEVGSPAKIRTRGLSSWTFSPQIGEDFTTGGGIVVSAKIPPERMLMSMLSFRSYSTEAESNEYEVAVMGAMELDLEIVSSSSKGKKASKNIIIDFNDKNENWLSSKSKKTKIDKTKKDKKKASLSSIVLKVARSNSHVRKLLILELGKTLRN